MFAIFVKTIYDLFCYCQNLQFCLEDIVKFLLNSCVSFTIIDMDEEIVTLPPKPTYDIKTKSLRSSAFSSAFANQPEYINVKAKPSPVLVPSPTTETSPSVKPKKIVELVSKQAESSENIGKPDYINVQTGITPNVLPLSPKMNLHTTTATFHDHNT